MLLVRAAATKLMLKPPTLALDLGGPLGSRQLDFQELEGMGKGTGSQACKVLIVGDRAERGSHILTLRPSSKVAARAVSLRLIVKVRRRRLHHHCCIVLGERPGFSDTASKLSLLDGMLTTLRVDAVCTSDRYPRACGIAPP